MSFLTRYWHAVEKQISETGMNPGDIVIDVNSLQEKNTVVDNVVEPQPTVTQPTIDRPAEDGDMPQRKEPDIFESERGSARPDRRIEEAPTRARKAKSRNHSGDKDDARWTKGSVRSETKETIRANDKLRKKALKKLGAGRRVNVLLDKVVVNGEHFHRTAAC